MSNSKIVKYGGIFIGLIILAGIAASILLPAGQQENSTQPARVAAPATPPSPFLAPEMIVRPVHGQFLAACQSPQLLTKLIGHVQAHEKTKFEAMFTNLSCAEIPEAQRFKVLSISNGMVEFVNSASGASDGMWAVVEAFTPAK